MSWIIAALITLVVTALSLILISKIPPIGVEISTVGKAFVSALVFGLLNAFVEPVLRFFGAPINFLTFGLFGIIINAITFGLAAWLVEGFRLRNGFVSALLGSLALMVINYIVSNFLGLPDFAPTT